MAGTPNTISDKSRTHPSDTIQDTPSFEVYTAKMHIFVHPISYNTNFKLNITADLDTQPRDPFLLT